MKTAAAFLALAFPSLAFAGEGAPFVGNYTTNCPSPHQCSLAIMEHQTEDGLKTFAAFTVTTRDNDALPMCQGEGGFVFPMILNNDGVLVSANRDFVVRINLKEGGLYVDGIPDALCGVRLVGTYQEIGD